MTRRPPPDHEFDATGQCIWCAYKDPLKASVGAPANSAEKPLILTVQQIIDLADFAGIPLQQNGVSDLDDLETEIVIADCPNGGVLGDDGSQEHYSKVAYYYDYPEEGVQPLGPKIQANEKGQP